MPLYNRAQWYRRIAEVQSLFPFYMSGTLTQQMVSPQNYTFGSRAPKRYTRVRDIYWYLIGREKKYWGSNAQQKISWACHRVPN